MSTDPFKNSPFGDGPFWKFPNVNAPDHQRVVKNGIRAAKWGMIGFVVFWLVSVLLGLAASVLVLWLLWKLIHHL